MRHSVGAAAIGVLGAIGSMIASAGTVYVWSGSPTPGEPFSTWDTAAHNVQDAVHFAHTNTLGYRTVQLTNETYIIDAQLQVTNAVTVRGAGRDATVIRRAATGNSTPRHRIFSVNHAGAVVESLTMQYGHTENSNANRGGGVELLLGLVHDCAIRDSFGGGAHHGAGAYVVGAGAVVSNCLIVASHGSWRPFGGGAYIGAGGLVTHSELRDGTGDGGSGGVEGGGAYISGGTLRWSVVANNSNGSNGTGVYMTSNSAGLIEYCVITNNAAWANASPSGGGVYMAGAGTIRNSLLARNATPGSGGGLRTGSNSLVENCTIADNFAGNEGGGLYSAGGTIMNCALGGNIATTFPDACTNAGTFVTCLLPGGAPGTGNLDDDPRFVNPDLGDYRLAAASLGIDAGTDLGWMSGTAVDLDGQPRILLTRSDIGAYEAPETLRCAFITDTTGGLAPLSVTFTASVTGSDLDGLSYQWDFDGDGNIDASGSDKATISHPYAAGSYQPVLSVTNAAGASAVFTGLVSVVASPGTLYVWSGGTHTPPYDTWGTAANDVHSALQAAADGAHILVTNGTYQLSASIEIDRAITIASVNGAGVTTLRRNATLGSEPRFRVLKLNHPDAVVRGFTLTNGNAFEPTGYSTYAVTRGGGAYVLAGTLADCTISANIANQGNRHGAGLYLVDGTVSNCLITANNTDWGGLGAGAFVAGGELIDSRLIANYHSGGNSTSGGGAYQTGGAIRDCVFTGNTVHSGGGLYQTGGMADRCVFTNNTAMGNSGTGGGVRMTGGTLRNSLMARNIAQRNTTDAGGGLYLSGTDSLVENCTIAENEASHASGTGGGVAATAGTLLNCIVYFNAAAAGNPNVALSGTASMTYSCATPKPDGAANTDGNPLFTDRTALDYTLLPGSAALDSGSYRDWMEDATDLAGQDRISGAAVDMGAYEREFVLACSFTADQVSGLAPHSATFTALVIGDPEPEALHYYWDFDNDGLWDADGVGLSTPTHPFSGGLHSIRLMVSNTTTEATASFLATDYIISAPETMYVSTDGTHIMPYDTWERAATNPAAPMVLATDGVTLIVSNGTYLVDSQIMLDRAITIRSVNGASSTRIERNAPTALGLPRFRLFRLDHPDAVLDGLTIAKGYAFEELLAGSNHEGGGVRMSAGRLVNSVITACVGSGSTLGAGLYISGGTASNCVIVANIPDWGGHGAGAYVAGGHLSDSVISGNYKTGGNQLTGGGLRVAGGTVSRCTVAGNSAHYGGGIYQSGGLVDTCIITNNTAITDSGVGGGVRMTGGSLRSSLVAHNTAQRNALDAGGGVYLSSGVIENCTITTNQASHASGTGGGLYASGGGITNTIVYFNTAPGGHADVAITGAATIGYSCSPDLVHGVNGNLTSDPGFVAPALNDFRLATGSPALRAGINRDWMEDATDLDGNPRRFGRFVDMGCYESMMNPGSLILLR